MTSAPVTLFSSDLKEACVGDKPLLQRLYLAASTIEQS